LTVRIATFLLSCHFLTFFSAFIASICTFPAMHHVTVTGTFFAALTTKFSAQKANFFRFATAQAHKLRRSIT
jgi:hypothetical protein